MPKVSLIIVNYNGKDLITSCLKNLEDQSVKDFEIIIVDNGSIDGSPNEIQKYSDRSSITSLIRLLSLDKNAGFGGGNLEGLKQACGEYIALLNNDTEPDGRWLEELVMAMDNDPKVGICASKLIVYGSDIIDSAGDGFSTSLKGFKRGEGESGRKYSEQEYVFGACAGAALYRREMLEEIGFFMKTSF